MKVWILPFQNHHHNVEFFTIDISLFQKSTRAHVQNPSVPNSLPSLTFVRPQDQQHHRVRFRTGSLTLATVLAVVSSVARHGLPVLYRADPARSQLQLLPLPGIWPATVAVFITSYCIHFSVLFLL